MLLLLYSSHFSFAEILNDTVLVDGEYYIKHTVSNNENLSSIANQYNIRVKEILEHNETSGRLYYNQLLYIPISKRKPKKSKYIGFFDNLNKKVSKEENTFLRLQVDTGYLNIALLLPFYVPENDTLVDSFEEKQEAKYIIYERSKMALSFLQGVELALDSLQKIGLNLTLHVFDTANDSAKVDQLVNSNNLSDMDIIIGPLYSKNLKIITKAYGKDKTKRIISPLSRNVDVLKSNPSVYQINTSFKQQANIIKEYVLKNYKDKKLYIFYQEKDRSYALYMRQLFKKSDHLTSLQSIEYTHVDSMRNLVAADQCVVIPSYDNVFASKMLSALGGIDSNFVVFGLNNWKNFNNLDINNLMQLNTHIPDPFYFDENSNSTSRFIFLFETKYKSATDRFSFLGYQLLFHFLSSADVYQFRRHGVRSGFVNIKAPIVRFSKYSLTKGNN